MKMRGGFEPCDNAQATVKGSSMLIVGQHITEQAYDKQQLVPTLAVISPVIGQVGNALVDSGNFSATATQTVETGEQSPTVYAAMKRQSHGRSVAPLEVREDPSPSPPPDAPVDERMAHWLHIAEGKQFYG